MRFRCAQCRALTQVQIPARMTAPVITPCSGCGRKYRFAVDRPRAADDQERYRLAREFGEANQIDLGSAYSVLEGVMTLEEAHALRKGLPPLGPGVKSQGATAAGPIVAGPRATLPVSAPSDIDEALLRVAAASAAPKDSRSERVPKPAPAARTPSTPRSVVDETETSFDTGFAEAVRDGCLTPQQATERGDRRGLALRLAQRHRLSMELALRVADNRMTVHQAVQQKAAREAKEPPRPQTSVSHGVWNFTVFSVGAMILAGLGVHVYHVWGDYLAQRGMAILQPAPAAAAPRAHIPAPAEAPPGIAPPPPLTVPKSDSTGQLVEVVGPDPKSVLISFCMSGRQSGRREAIEIAPTVPPDASARWGLFRNLDNPSMPPRAILIRKDARTGRWSAGDGRTPIMTETPPPPPPGTKPVPVSEADGSAGDAHGGGSFS
jgi:hypothetical protein